VGAALAVNAADEPRRGWRYLLAGAWNTLFGYGSFVVLCRAASALGVHYLIALSISHVLATTNAYLSYKHFVFKTSGGAVREYFRFTLVYWAIFAVNLAALPALIRATGLGAIAAQGIITAFAVAASYLAHSRFSFRADSAAP
jgi:putative flippase GtrA